MITAFYRPDGSLESVGVDYQAMSPAEREDIVAWVKAHGVEPARVPVFAVIGYDPAAHEWSFPLFIRASGRNAIRIDLATQEPMIRRVRRRVRCELPPRRAADDEQVARWRR